MAVQAQFAFGGLAGCLLPYGGGSGGGLAEEQMQALLSATAGNKPHRYKYNSAAESDLTCNGRGTGVVPPSRKRVRDAEHDQHVSSSQPSPAAAAAAALLPIPGTHMQQAIAGHQLPLPALGAATTACRLAESATTSTSGRPASGAHVLASELQRQHSAEIDALVRAECDLLRAGLEQARKRQCDALARAAAAAAAAAPALREVEAELAAALRRAADLEELLREAAAECQAWCGLARSNGAVAAGLRAAIDAVLRQGAGGAGTALPAVVEGFGDSGGGTDDAQSCCCCYEEEQAAETAAASASASSSSSWNWNGRWACKACGEGEASVLLLPCRHLCLCKACERRTEACPVCLATKNACIHVAAD